MAKRKYTIRLAPTWHKARVLVGVIACLCVAACEDSPQARCVKARLKVWDAHSENTPWRISEATGQTRSDFEAKARVWCAQEAALQ